MTSPDSTLAPPPPNADPRTPPPPGGPGVERPSPLKRLYLWVRGWADTPYGTPALFVLAFTESSFFLIPPDVLQIALSVAKPKRSFFYALVSMIGSVLGGVLGWYIGWALWSSISGLFFDYVPGVTPEAFETVRVKFEEHAFLAVFSAAFSPIPYKVFTIASGVFGVGLPILIGASVLGRGARFFFVATAIYFFGPTVKVWLDRYFGLITGALVVLLVLGFVAVKYVL